MATLIVKVTEKCNSNCYYCDVVYKKNTGGSMSIPLLEMVFKRINEYLELRREENIVFIWHGGEPLMAGLDFYRKAVEFQEKICHSTKHRIRHSIQTNLTLMDDDFASALKKLGMNNIGSSYDPEPHMRGPGSAIDSDTYNKKFINGMSVLQKHGMGLGIIYVVTKKSLMNPLDIYYFLSNLMIPGGFNMNPVLIYDEERKEVSVTPDEYVDFLGTIFPVWWKTRKRYPTIEPFRSLVDTIVDNNISLGCVESGNCTYDHVNIAPDGGTSQCGRSADWGLLDYGNIAEKTLESIIRDAKRDELEERQAVLHDGECFGCRLWNICHGGCPLDAYSKHKSFMHKSEWCYSRKGFIEKYFEPVTGVTFEPRN